MNGNYIKSKFLLGFGIFTILFGIINLSAFAQQTKLVNTKIKQSNDAYGNRLKSSVTNKNQIKSRNSLVSAWKKHDPSVAPFLGSWLAYETIWSIYPSSRKGQVCLVRREMNTAVLDVGRVRNGKIHLQSGWVISPTGEYLQVTAPDFGERLKIFGTLEEPSTLQYVDNSYLKPLLRAYKQAGCTASLPPKSSNISKKSLPTVDILNPIAENIRVALPQGIVMRSPAIQLQERIYPAIDTYSNSQSKDSFRVSLYSEPNCRYRGCDLGYIAVFPKNTHNETLNRYRHTPIGNGSGITGRATVTLKDGIKGTYVASTNVSAARSAAVYWEQDGLIFLVASDLDKQTTIDMAKSMANRSPILAASSKNTASNSNSQSTLPSQELVNVIRKHTSNPNYSNVEYSFFEIDLNGDGNKDAIVYETGRHCGMAMCYFHVFLNTGDRYQLLWGQNGLPTYNAKVAILKDSNSGFVNIAIPRYSLNPSEYDKVKGWTTYQFNGKEYTKSGVSDSIDYKTIIDFEQAKRFNLALPGTSSQNTTALNNTPSSKPQIKIPDSFKLTLDNGMKTEFVKGEDGYYTWFVTNYIISDTCLGLKDNQNPAKVKLAPYGCKSKKKARKWEIVMANNNTGYKVKLPNTSYCLADNVGVVDCNNSEATVIDLTPEQLKSWGSR